MQLNHEIQLGPKTYYINECRVHPNPTETIYTVWEQNDGHSTITHDRGTVFGCIGTRRFECDLRACDERTRRFESHKAEQQRIVQVVLANFFDEETFPALRFDGNEAVLSD